MSKHTPGPWIARKGAGWYVTRPDAMKRRESALGVGMNATSTIVEAPDWENEGEAEANARLMAAAPDLLHALEEIIRGSVTDADTCTYCGLYPWSHASGCPVDAARKVVAKAKGETE